MLTKKQIEVIKNGWKEGFFYYWDLSKVYTTKQSKEDCVRHLLALKIIDMRGAMYKYYINRDIYNKIIDSEVQLKL